VNRLTNQEQDFYAVQVDYVKGVARAWIPTGAEQHGRSEAIELARRSVLRDDVKAAAVWRISHRLVWQTGGGDGDL